MKKTLKLILAVVTALSFMSCKDEQKISFKGDIPITENTVLRINDEIVKHSDVPNASIYAETLEGDAIALTLKNIVVGHPEIDILCNNTITKGAPIEASFSGTAIYADIMEIQVSGNFNENHIDLLEIKTDYEYDIVGRWHPRDFILEFSNPKVPTDELGLIETAINDIIKETGSFNGRYIELTNDGFTKNYFQYYIDKMANLLYFYMRHSYTEEFIGQIESVDSSSLAILKKTGLYDILVKAVDITIPTKYELSGKDKDRKLKIYMNQETFSPYMSLFKDTVKKYISEIENLKYSDFPFIIGKMTPEQFEMIKKECIFILNLYLDPETTYQIGINYDIAS